MNVTAKWLLCSLLAVTALLSGCANRTLWNDNGELEEATQNRTVWDTQGQLDKGERKIWVNKNGEEVIR